MNLTDAIIGLKQHYRAVFVRGESLIVQALDGSEYSVRIDQSVSEHWVNALIKKAEIKDKLDTIDLNSRL